LIDQNPLNSLQGVVPMETNDLNQIQYNGDDGPKKSGGSNIGRFILVLIVIVILNLVSFYFDWGYIFY
jgi:hypothetical protein